MPDVSVSPVPVTVLGDRLRQAGAGTSASLNRIMDDEMTAFEIRDGSVLIGAVSVLVFSHPTQRVVYATTVSYLLPGCDPIIEPSLMRSAAAAARSCRLFYGMLVPAGCESEAERMRLLWPRADVSNVGDMLLLFRWTDPVPVVGNDPVASRFRAEMLRQCPRRG